MRLTLIPLLACLCVPAAAATLRGATTLDHPMVRIADLFDDAGPGGERVLGPGPAPGGRIVVEAPQLAAIARQFGVNWRAASAGERVLIERPGKFVPREMVLDSLRAALQSAGAASDAEIDVPGLVTPLVAIDAVAQTAIEQLDYDPAAGRFTAMLAVAAGAEPIQRMRISGNVREMAEYVVASHRLAPGTVIGPGDLTLRRQRATAGASPALHDPQEAFGLELRRTANAGQTIAPADLAVPFTIQKGARVTMELLAPGLSISGTGQALDPGVTGATIRVLNPASRAIVEAEIIGPGRVRVTPGAAPRTATPTQVTQR